MPNREGMTQDKRRDELIEHLKPFKQFWTVEDYADFILARERSLIEKHDILTKTILDTKNAEIKELTEEVKKGMKQALINEQLRGVIERVEKPLKEALVDYDNHPIHANFPLDGNYKQIDAEKNFIKGKNAGLLEAINIFKKVVGAI